MRPLRNCLNKVANELDRFLALAVLLVSAGLTVFLAATKSIYAIGTLLALIVCVVYLVLRKRLPTLNLTSPAQAKSSSKIYLLLNVIFFALLTCSILSLYLRPELYVRPLSYFVSTALMATIVGTEIIFLPSEKSRSYFVVFKIIMIGLSLRLSQMSIFAGVLHNDAWMHQFLTNEMLNTGHIASGSEYSMLPLMYLLVGSTSLITGTAYKLATMFSLTSMQIICDALFAFLLARAIFADKPDWGNRVGLLAALFLAVANYYIQISYWAIPNTLGGMFILPVIYLLLTRRRNPLLNTSLAILFIVALLLTHTVTMACLIILLFALWLASYIYQKIRHEGTSFRVILIISVSLVAAVLGWWTYSGHIIMLALKIKDFLAPAIVEGAVLAHAPPLEQLFAYLGILLFFAFSIMGLLYMLSKFEKEYSFTMAFGGLAIFGITVFSILTGRGFTIISNRWLYFSQIILAIPLAIAFLLLYKGFRAALGRTLTPVILILILPFFMIISPPANMDNATFYPSSFARYAFTQSELQGIETILDSYDGKIGGDFYSGLPIDPIDYPLHDYSYKFVDIKSQLVKGDFSSCHDMLVLIRDEITRHAFPAYFDLPTRIDYDPYSRLNEQGFSRIYSDGSVSAFVWQG